MRSLFLSCLGIAALVVASLFSQVASSCPFCSAPSLTLGEQLAAAQSAVLVQWIGGKEANRDEGFTGTTDYEIVQIVRGDSKKLKKGEKITVDRYRSGKAGELFLLLGTVVENQTEWNSPLEVTEASFQYIVQAPSKESPTRDRLAYFMKFLEYPDPTVATDAYGEFANAPYDDIVPLADEMPREKLRKWLSDPEITPTRIGLYGLMLGLSGKAEDAEFLKAKVIEEPEDFRLGIDGVMGGYLLLTGKEGLQVLDETKLSNTKAHFSETFAAMQALRFMWTYGKGRIPAEDLRHSMRLLLRRPNLADLVIVDLARWQDWATMPELMSLYDNKDYQVPSVKRAIVRFMLIAEKDAPVAADAEVPAHVKAARANLELLREKDPKTVKAAERYFFD
ncbi:hypothetical protein SH661x_001403 [Planctomicrobium sp. SH661]|uniref:hypothetical protein n=1 Tax=Planctomicrobium sp. SH661 TaxID=3448124 RepID=UPI003F5C7741